MIIGEAPGETEERLGKPFLGAAGKLLSDLLKIAEIDRDSCYITNVFMDRPPGNKIEAFFTNKKEAKAEWEGNGLPFPDLPLRPGKFLKVQYASEISRLASEIREVNPFLIITLGATASWAVLDSPKIGHIRS